MLLGDFNLEPLKLNDYNLCSTTSTKKHILGPHRTMTTEATPDDLALPAPLADLANIASVWEWDDSRGCDFELYKTLEAPEQTAWWLRLWTGNDDVDGKQFRFFGTSAAGDYAGFWLARPDVPLTEQPVVYVGSEGERGVIARNVGDLLWIFANGSGPVEAFRDPEWETQHIEEVRAIAERHAPGKSLSTAEIVAAAQEEFPEFPDLIDAMC